MSSMTEAHGKGRKAVPCMWTITSLANPWRVPALSYGLMPWTGTKTAGDAVLWVRHCGLLESGDFLAEPCAFRKRPVINLAASSGPVWSLLWSILFQHRGSWPRFLETRAFKGEAARAAKPGGSETNKGNSNE